MMTISTKTFNQMRGHRPSSHPFDFSSTGFNDPWREHAETVSASERSKGQLTQPLNGGTFNGVKITFDPVKHQTALSERGLNFADASIVFAGPTITVQDTRRDYGETRLQTIGFLDGRMVMVVWTPREEARHVISMRKCNDREKAIYQKRFGQG